MDQVVIKYYRQLLRTGFEHAGLLENATILVDSVTEQIVHCGNIGNYMQLYINVSNYIISDITYVCSCDPSANVAVEILCTLIKGKTFEEASTLTERAICQFLGSESEELLERAKNLLELLNKGISRYKLSQATIDNNLERT
jgi:NifU-like protein involved in Fe-S cluster formation